MKLTLDPRQAWEPVSTREWTAAHARHLFRRASWAAVPEAVDESIRRGPFATVERMFGATPSLPMPEAVAEAAERLRTVYQRAREAPTPEARRRFQREVRQQAVAAYQEMTVKWLQFSTLLQNAAYEKWVTFLQDVFVVSIERVRNPEFIFRHHDLLRTKGTGSYLDLCRDVSRSPAMLIYLDLQQSKRSAPNENFARELFELFVLGEGNYTEKDIKEAARAFTGYRHRQGEFYFAERQQDPRPKTVFGRTGRWTGDDVIRLALDETAASTFLPRELCRFYLTEAEIPLPYLEQLGQIWRQANFNLGTLLQRFFTSRLFYENHFRGNLIKSPLHFHLGLVQDLQLTVPPFPRTVLVRYRQMGQHLYHPPNVRGWVGGQLWINSSSLSARRQLVKSLFQPVNEERLNADERAALNEARKEGRVELFVSRDRLRQLAKTDPNIVASRFIDFFLPGPASADYRRTLADYLTNGPGNRMDRIETAAMTILQSPEYNLC